MQFRKFALIATALTSLSSPAWAQESLVPRTIPLDDSGTPAAKKMPAVAPLRVAPAPATTATKTVSPSSGMTTTTATPAPAMPAETPVAGATQNPQGSGTSSAVNGAPATTVPMTNSSVPVPIQNAQSAGTASGTAQVVPNLMGNPDLTNDSAASDTQTIAQPVPGAPKTPVAEQESQTRMNEIFDEMDTNGDGLVNETEFSKYYKVKGDDPGFIRYDQNNDGQITRVEFTAGNTIGRKTVVPPTN